MQYITRTERRDRTPVWIFSKPLYDSKITSKATLISNLRGAMLYGVTGEKIHTVANLTTFSYGRTSPVPYLFKKIPTLTEMVEYKGEPVYFSAGLMASNAVVGDYVIVLNHAPYAPATVDVNLQQNMNVYSKPLEGSHRPTLIENVEGALQVQFTTIGETSVALGGTVDLLTYSPQTLPAGTRPTIARVSSSATKKSMSNARADLAVKVHSLIRVEDDEYARPTSPKDVSTAPIYNSGETAMYVGISPHPPTPSTSWNRGNVDDAKIACTLDGTGNFLKIQMPDDRIRLDPVYGVTGALFSKEFYVSTRFPGPIHQQEI